MVLKVCKRDGRREPVAFDKISSRIKSLCSGLDMNFVDPTEVAQKVIVGVYDGVTTRELDNLAAETAAYMTTKHPDYALLAARIAISNLHKETKKQFSAVIEELYRYINPKTGAHSPMVSAKTYRIVMQNAERLNSAILYSRDFGYNYFGFKTLERSYLLRCDNKIAERPQHMLMRVALGIHGDDIDAAIESYNLMSERFFTHATPTLFNAGTNRPQLSSCFLVAMEEDSIHGIFNTLSRCALISKSAGGIGLHVHNIRSTGSYISGTGGRSNGLVPMLRVFNNTARYVDQGGNKRPGAMAIYLEPWHPDVYEFLELRKNHGKEEARARDLFYALWIPDLFMKRVSEDSTWSLFCPAEAPGLADVWGDEFENLYVKYEREGRARRTVKAQHLWYAILEAQIETGNPYMLYKDSCNRKSNHQHLGTIKCSNLCTEIVEYTAPDEVAVCNLASLSLPAFVARPATAKQLLQNAEISDKFDLNVCSCDCKTSTDENSRDCGCSCHYYESFDFKQLHAVTKVVARNLNKVIDVNYYPVPEARNSNMRHRPIGIGVQGLADTFMMLGYAFDDPAARQLNRDIFETIYHAALEASCELAKEVGPYETYSGSPVSNGVLQCDMWDVEPTGVNGVCDWARLRKDIKAHGVRNSLLLAPMPTASTSQILGNNEAFEPFTSNLYTRRVLAGEFQIVNPHLLQALISLNLWDDAMRNRLVSENGSIQNISGLPESVRRVFRTVWEISQRSVLDMAADRAAYIDQSQSLNVHIAAPSFAKLTSMHFHGWKLGLKTGMYYLRTRPAVDAIKFTVDQTALRKSSTSIAASSETEKSEEETRQQESLSCSIENRFDCQSCSG